MLVVSETYRIIRRALIKSAERLWEVRGGGEFVVSKSESVDIKQGVHKYSSLIGSPHKYNTQKNVKYKYDIS